MAMPLPLDPTGPQFTTCRAFQLRVGDRLRLPYGTRRLFKIELTQLHAYLWFAGSTANPHRWDYSATMAVEIPRPPLSRS